MLALIVIQPVPGRAVMESITRTDLIESARALRGVLLEDRHRPTYHITTPEGVCAPFDPNAALFWKGRIT